MSGREGAFEPRRPAGCLSEYGVERLRTGELAGPARESARAHVASCARCGAIADELAGAAASLPPWRRAPAGREGRRRPVMGIAAGVVAVAVACLVVYAGVGPDGDRTDGVRLKGGVRLGFHVKHGAAVRAGSPGERVTAGDVLRFSVTTPAPGWLAVLSRDGAGRGSVYYPAEGSAMARIEAGPDQPLPTATVLDAVLGAERICAFVCVADRGVEGLRPGFEAGGAPPAECASDCVTVEKSAGVP